MAYELGKDWRVEIGDGVTPTEVFTKLGGEGSFSWTQQSDEIDLKTKDDDEYGLGDYGLVKISFSVNGKVKLPDVALQRVADVSKSTDKKLNVRIRKGTTTKFLGNVAIGNFSSEWPTEGPGTYSFSAMLAGVPTTNDMGA